ncbi:MAG: tRNA uridine(34) 5-carboxymethylaminomethyl modification radical SAM/GNAT enzyme Elp3 [Myxococcota bacterium]|nr:tRNA uridine(34) 5-carboxymethylaminomethyl modification radical SAM/GNAT enzyme Elp3 [Myxococcota bacterium]
MATPSLRERGSLAPQGDASAPESSLGALIEGVIAAESLDERSLLRLQRRHPRPGGGFWSKRDILEAFHREQARDPSAYACDARTLGEKLRTCPTRSLSGVLPVTVLTRPFPCPGRCTFCPSDVRMPKSYVASEPGCQRAEQHAFDPYAQTWSRLDAYRRMGHPTGKVELILLGGTWSHYPKAYQRWFVARCFDALCDFGDGVDGRGAGEAVLDPSDPISGRNAAAGEYDRRIQERLRSLYGGRLTAPHESATVAALEASKRRNETARCRCVGLSVETRPDRVSVAEARRLRALGVTKVQLGIQSLDDRVLARSRRGHDVGATHRAIAILRAAGFKLHVHWMANLPGSDPEADRRDFARLFSDPRVRPDELKVYPTSLLETAELMRDYESGRWRPYAPDELVELLVDCLPTVPDWCRVTRVIRDIPSPEIHVGNRETNLRERVERTLAERGVRLREIRSREVRGERPEPDETRIVEHVYETALGVERFLEARTAAGRLAGFLRLFLPRRDAAAEFAASFPELEGNALLREVHVYGQATDPGESATAAQHAGLGRRLVRRAAERARCAGHAGLAVISAVGTHAWYREQGFVLEAGSLYPTLPLRAPR